MLPVASPAPSARGARAARSAAPCRGPPPKKVLGGAEKNGGAWIVSVDQMAAIEFGDGPEQRASSVCAPLTLRAGIASGHALLFEGDDYIGSAVNMAARCVTTPRASTS